MVIITLATIGCACEGDCRSTLLLSGTFDQAEVSKTLSISACRNGVCAQAFVSIGDTLTLPGALLATASTRNIDGHRVEVTVELFDKDDAGAFTDGDLVEVIVADARDERPLASTRQRVQYVTGDEMCCATTEIALDVPAS